MKTLDDRNWLTPPDDPEPLARCDYCGAELYIGDLLYTIDGEHLCSDCVRTWYGEVITGD